MLLQTTLKIMSNGKNSEPTGNIDKQVLILLASVLGIGFILGVIIGIALCPYV